MSAAPQQPPFFVVGAQRSGTTLLRLMLDHHPQIRVAHEFDFAVERMSDTGEWPPLPAYRAWLPRQGSFRRSGLRLDPTLDYPQLMESLLRQHQGEKSVVGMVVHQHFPRLLRLWPEARFVHLLRDPRDVARSVVERGWAGNVWKGVERWIQAEQSWDVVRAQLPRERWIELHYEHLASRPEEVLGRVCAFLGVPYDPEMLTYAGHSTYDLPDARGVFRWRSQLSSREQRLVESRLGALLEERGYRPSGLPPLSVGRLRRTGLGIQDRLGRARFRVRRFGAGWVLLRIIARSLAPRSIRVQVKRHFEKVADRMVR